MESFFALLQKNGLDRHAWTTRDELRIAIVTWIEPQLPGGERLVSWHHGAPLVPTLHVNRTDMPPSARHGVRA
nr:hypothetical protein [Janibacter massiliensis]